MSDVTASQAPSAVDTPSVNSPVAPVQPVLDPAPVVLADGLFDFTSVGSPMLFYRTVLAQYGMGGDLSAMLSRAMVFTCLRATPDFPTSFMGALTSFTGDIVAIDAAAVNAKDSKVPTPVAELVTAGEFVERITVDFTFKPLDELSIPTAKLRLGVYRHLKEGDDSAKVTAFLKIDQAPLFIFDKGEIPVVLESPVSTPVAPTRPQG